MPPPKPPSLPADAYVNMTETAVETMRHEATVQAALRMLDDVPRASLPPEARASLDLAVEALGEVRRACHGIVSKTGQALLKAQDRALTRRCTAGGAHVHYWLDVPFRPVGWVPGKAEPYEFAITQTCPAHERLLARIPDPE